MAKTGIKITVTDSVLGAPIDVNTTSMFMFEREDAGDFRYPIVRGNTVKDFEKGLESYEGNKEGILQMIDAYFHPMPNVSLEGNLLWVCLIEDTDPSTIAGKLRLTTQSSFAERPRQIVISNQGRVAPEHFTISVEQINSGLATAANEGIRCVAIIGGTSSIEGEFNEIADFPTYADKAAPFVALCPMVDEENSDTPVWTGAAKAMGLLSSVSVGTSIGDGGLTAMTSPQFIALHSGETEEYQFMDVKTLRIDQLDTLGDKQVLFTRTRPPRNGLWWNDGATCNDPANALSTLEMSRTICAMADDLQSFFVPYINTRVPVTSTGDIQSAYKQVVLDNARAAVVQRYIESGDISDARISLVAKNNDMIGTRTWEVTLSILPAPTLRWIDGYVFYVKSLE